MEEIFQFIVSNIVFVLIIIGGLISMFRNKANTEQENQRPSPIPKTADDLNKKAEEIKETIEKKELPSNQDIPKNVQETITTFSPEELREEQLKRLKERVESTQSLINETTINQKSENLSKLKQQTNVSKKPLKMKQLENESLPVQIKNNLTRNGLAQSIVMMEILGPPRSMRQHSFKNQNR